MRKLLLALCVALPAFATFPNGYNYCKVVTTSSTMVSGSADLTNYPLTVILTDTDLRTTGNGGLVNNASGYDIGFYPDCTGIGSALKWEMESYTASTGAIVAHVLRPTLSHTTNDTIGMFYGGSFSSFQSTVSAVWDANYKGVWHLPAVSGGASSVLDSTSNGNNGSPSGSPTDAAFQVNGGGSFTAASSQYIDLGSGSSLNQTAAITIEAWARWTTTLAAGRIYSKLSGPNYAGAELILAVNVMELQVGNGTGSGGTIGSGLSTLDSSVGSLITANTTYHVVATYDGTNARIYLNGALSSGPTSFGASAIGSTAINANISRFPGSPGTYWQGLIDEVRVSSIARSTDWILTEYRNQSAPGSYLSEGSRLTAAGVRHRVIGGEDE